MTAVAKVLKSGSSQSVRLPKEFRIQTDEVYLRHTPAGILISECSPWDGVEAACQQLSDEYLTALDKRAKRPPQKRPWPDKV